MAVCKVRSVSRFFKLCCAAKSVGSASVEQVFCIVPVLHKRLQHTKAKPAMDQQGRL